MAVHIWPRTPSTATVQYRLAIVAVAEAIPQAAVAVTAVAEAMAVAAGAVVAPVADGKSPLIVSGCFPACNNDNHQFKQ